MQWKVRLVLGVIFYQWAMWPCDVILPQGASCPLTEQIN